MHIVWGELGTFTRMHRVRGELGTSTVVHTAQVSNPSNKGWGGGPGRVWIRVSDRVRLGLGSRDSSDFKPLISGFACSRGS